MKESLTEQDELPGCRVPAPEMVHFCSQVQSLPP
jgi:hypothetical protein